MIHRDGKKGTKVLLHPLQVVEELDTFYTSTIKHVRTEHGTRGFNKGFVLGRLKCKTKKPSTPALL